MNEPKTVTVKLDQHRGVDFGFHVENGEIIIDECDGIFVEQGLSLFPDWAIASMIEKSKESK